MELDGFYIPGKVFLSKDAHYVLIIPRTAKRTCEHDDFSNWKCFAIIWQPACEKMIIRDIGIIESINGDSPFRGTTLGPIS
ncbi:MAG: hypothetical protein A2Z96_03085 [Spirochaetes bacterium GWB1_48_6]|nr:MAG: hypothetical protein A2Z96_03085 [Spirochaetes bacterium GWB1_48_6]